MKRYRIGVVGGDGIGPEVTREALKVLEAVETAGLAGFDVDVTCTTTSHTELGNAYDLYFIGVEARAGTYGTPDYVSRRMQATVTNATE